MPRDNYRKDAPRGHSDDRGTEEGASRRHEPGFLVLGNSSSGNAVLKRIKYGKIHRHSLTSAVFSGCACHVVGFYEIVK